MKNEIIEDETIELVRGSGNVFADFGHINANSEQLKSLLAAEIINALATQKLTTREASEITGITEADFSRIRKVKLDRFTIDRLMMILDRLDQEVNVQVSVSPRYVADALPVVMM